MGENKNFNGKKLFNPNDYRSSTGRGSSKSNTAMLFKRYVWLVDLISRAGRITFKEIQRSWENSPLNEYGESLPLKTFHNHKSEILEMFGISIACRRRGGYTYYIENSEDLKTEGAKRWLLNSFAVGNIMTESKSLGNRILFEEIPSGQQFLTPIIEAMRDSLTVEIVHQSFGKEKHTYEVEPYCVKVFKQRWYMAAFNREYDDIRIYALDRIHNVNVTGNHFSIPADFNAEEFFANSFGVMRKREGNAESVILKVCGNEIDYLRTLPLHHSQTELNTHDSEEFSYANIGTSQGQEDKGCVYFKYFIYPTIDFQQELLAHCIKSEIEIVEPVWLRDKIKNIAENIVEKHSIIKNITY